MSKKKTTKPKPKDKEPEGPAPISTETNRQWRVTDGTGEEYFITEHLKGGGDEAIAQVKDEYPDAKPSFCAKRVPLDE